MNETCSTCRFGHTITYDLYEGSDGDRKPTGQRGANTFCRFDPPEFIPPNSTALKPVGPDGWCGKWQSRPDTTVSVPAPVSDPNMVRSQKLSVRTRRKSGVAAII